MIDISKGKRSVLNTARANTQISPLIDYRTLHYKDSIRQQAQRQKERIKNVKSQISSIAKSKMNADFNIILKYRTMISKSSRSTIDKLYAHKQTKQRWPIMQDK
jgi:hypothetical protein